MSTQTPVKELKLTRTFDAPRALVFQAWTEARHVASWFAPDGFDVPECEWDARPGGKLYLVMEGHGMRAPMSGVFTEVEPVERLVFMSETAFDEVGVPGMEIRTSLTFVEEAGKTVLHVHAEVLKADPSAAFALSGMDEGWKQSLDHLVTFVAEMAGGIQ